MDNSKNYAGVHKFSDVIMHIILGQEPAEVRKLSFSLVLPFRPIVYPPAEIKERRVERPRVGSNVVPGKALRPATAARSRQRTGSASVGRGVAAEKIVAVRSDVSAIDGDGRGDVPVRLALSGSAPDTCPAGDLACRRFQGGVNAGTR
jgi:hypothetical protein